MIGKLNGRVDSCFGDYAIIKVGGVGYMVHCSAKTMHNLPHGQLCELFIETHVREDHIHLYGFLSLSEKESFNILQSVSGIGTRMALSILSNLTPEQISSAVNQKNKEAFRAISGVGPKLAERILIELKGKIDNVSIDYAAINSNYSISREIVSDAVSALTGLGINKSEAQNSVNNILQEQPNISVDELIKIVLKQRAK